MGQCVSRKSMAPYSAVDHYDSRSIPIGPGALPLPFSPYHDFYNNNKGQSESKGARKRSTTPSGKGAAMSFGFKKKGSNNSKTTTTTAVNTDENETNLDRNGNGGSTEELCTGNEVLSGRSTPLARPKKEAQGQPLRTNRFGFRQTAVHKGAKVADVNITAEQAITANHREQEIKNNNILKEKKEQKSNNVTFGLIPTQIGASGVATITSVPQKAVTKQTVILTYTTKQYPIPHSSGMLRSKSPGAPIRTPSYNIAPRSVSASRAYGTTSAYDSTGTRTGNVSKYTFQTNNLPRPQVPRVLNTKNAKQVANNTRKVYGSSDSSSKEGSGGEDSGLSGMSGSSQWSPTSGRRYPQRRPRTLEMVMKGDHNFHLRELQVNDLDIMDEAIITDVDVIPLPKLPSTFDNDRRFDKTSTYQSSISTYTRLQRNNTPLESVAEPSRTVMSTLEHYRNSRDTGRTTTTSLLRGSASSYDCKGGEEKVSRDSAQKENINKAESGSASTVHTPLTRTSSKDSSPSVKSEESHVSSASDPWGTQNAGESMALRDDISIGLSLSSSCDEDKGFNKTSKSPNLHNNEPSEFAKLTQHPVMMKSFNLSQNSAALQSILSSSTMSASFCSTSTNLTLADDPKLALSALASSNQSLIEDETSPADSLISSSSESNNDIPVPEKDVTMSSSAYHTADNRTIDVNNFKESSSIDEENIKEKNSNEKSSSMKNKSPNSPGTPTHASNSLSLSEGRDFLIDDEIADQPALIFEGNNSMAEQQTSSLQLLPNMTDSTPTLLDLSNKSSLQKSKGNQSTPKCPASPRLPHRSPSLDTLSPCDSIASDDLMMDMDLNHSVTSLNSVDEYIDRLDGSIRSGLNSIEDLQLREELLKFTTKKTSIKATNSEHSLFGTPMRNKNHSTSTSNSSIANIGATLPARSARLLSRSRAETPESPRVATGTGAPPPPPHDDTSLRIDKATHGSMQQDLVTIKTMLLKLKRVLQESEDGHNLMRTETLNPLEIQRDLFSLKNGPSLRLLGESGEESPPPPPPAPQEEVADLRRQLVFLQSQLEERERMVKILQQQMSKYAERKANGDLISNGMHFDKDEVCNVATQTDRIRMGNQGGSIIQSLTLDTERIVSPEDQPDVHKITPTHQYIVITPRKFTNGTKIFESPSTSDGESPNNPKYRLSSKSKIPPKILRQETSSSSSLDSNVESTGVMTKGRIGSRYLQAIADKNNTNNNKETRSKSLHSSTRSKSIENFTTLFTAKTTDSCRNLRKSSETSRNGSNCTDTDENSDSGYKSLPSSINLTGNRRNITGELKLACPAKFAQTTNC